MNCCGTGVVGAGVGRADDYGDPKPSAVEDLNCAAPARGLPRGRRCRQRCRLFAATVLRGRL